MSEPNEALVAELEAPIGASYRRDLDAWVLYQKGGERFGVIDSYSAGPLVERILTALRSADTEGLLREARDALDGLLTGLGLRPVEAGDGCSTVTLTIPSMQQMNAATEALAAIDAHLSTHSKGDGGQA